MHPYAYPQGQTLPFSALKQQPGLEESAQIEDRPRPMPTRESEVLSRGAGMRAGVGQGLVEADTSTPGKSGSIGMGTFGKDHKPSREPQGGHVVSHASYRAIP